LEEEAMNALLATALIAAGWVVVLAWFFGL
jgi:hypothetical protein